MNRKSVEELVAELDKIKADLLKSVSGPEHQLQQELLLKRAAELVTAQLAAKTNLESDDKRDDVGETANGTINGMMNDNESSADGYRSMIYDPVDESDADEEAAIAPTNGHSAMPFISKHVRIQLKRLPADLKPLLRAQGLCEHVNGVVASTSGTTRKSNQRGNKLAVDDDDDEDEDDVGSHMLSVCIRYLFLRVWYEL